MECIFRKENGTCFQTKKECLVENNLVCKYYLRQKPKSQEKYKKLYKKALKKALEKRDIYKNYNHLLEDSHIINFDKTIYENVKEIIDNIKPYTVIKKEIRKLTDEDLEGDILKNIANNLYNQVPIEIIQKFDKKKTIIIKENDQKYCCELGIAVDSFIEKLKRAKKKDAFIERCITSKIKLL